jgi:uncharacterized protein YndB with AHSA1/START domain
MISTDNIARAETRIAAPADKVWDALINPELIKRYMFGTTVISDWKRGSKIIWTGDWKGRAYEDKGTILEIEPEKKLQYSHFSSLSGIEDRPENYHTVTITLDEHNNQTNVMLEQDNNADETAKEHSEKNWKMMLDSLKKLLEEKVDCVFITISENNCWPDPGCSSSSIIKRSYYTSYILSFFYNYYCRLWTRSVTWITRGLR